ncbi:accessory gene regulator B family protein [Paenibacillus sp. y28]|uniref:accessory gene regulator B family protein n=1 Tax=Paenibacillus sp. y28 TaxID=3129110 RepID=UPI003016EB7D
MISSISQFIAAFLYNLNPHHTASLETQKYAIAMILNTVCTVVIAITISIFLDKIIPVIIILAAFSILRAVSGGYHFKSGDLCVVVSSITPNLIAFIHLPVLIIYFMNVVCLLLVLLYAPRNIEYQSNISPRFYPCLKLLSVMIVSINFFVVSPLLCVTYSLQCISLIKRGD